MASQSSSEPPPTLVATVDAAAAQFEQPVRSMVTSMNFSNLRSGRTDLGSMATFWLKAGNEQSLGGVIVNTAIAGKFPSLIYT